MTDSFLSVRGVTKRYAQHTALDNVSLEVPRGKVFGLLGPNGAGKTTLIRILNRITAPDAGEVVFDGHALCPADLASIGYLPEERGLYKKMKVGEQAVYLARLKGLSREEATRRLKAWFEKLDITPWWNRRLEELSKGMAQKVQFVITVLHEPDLLIFDEPFSGFDPVNAELLKREILELRDQGRTVIFSTHNMASVEDICDEIALIDRSKVALSGRVDEIKRRFRTGRYEVCGTGRLDMSVPGLYDVVESNETGGLMHYLLAKSPEATNSELATAVAGRMELQLFREQLPTMHEIFLKTVAQ